MTDDIDDDSGSGESGFDDWLRDTDPPGELSVPEGAWETAVGTAFDPSYELDTDLTAADWEKVVADYKAVVERELGHAFPQDPKDQLWGAVGAVFESWMNDRAKFYRRMHDIPESWGTAVNVQSMVFGNMGETSATGVAFTRNPSTGEARLYGEFLINAQGEDVVAGIRTPQSLTKIGREEMGETAPSMEEAMPEVFAQFV